MRLTILTALAAVASASHVLEVQPLPKGSFNVMVDGQLWLQSDEVMIRADGAEFRASNFSLKLLNNETFSGSDGYGDFTGVTNTWQAGSAQVTTVLRAYADENMAIFSTVYDTAADKVTCGDKDSTVSSFPSWNFGAIQGSSKGYYAITGDMCGSSPKYGTLDSGITDFPGGIDGTGPFVVFDPASTASLVISPAANFMSVSHAMHAPYLQSGVMGDASSIPAGFNAEFIIALGENGGINDAMDHWGRKLRERYNKGNRRDSDTTLRYLQYSTDNGAVYYYKTEDGKNYEQTIKDVWAYAAQEGIPYRNILLDSWWYYKGVNDGVKEWLPMPSIFPDGMTSVTNITGPPIAHNRYWASDNVYAKQNGGDWDWLIEGDISLPLTQGFWDWLMETSRNWGLRTYEQDWLDTVVDKLPSMTTNVTLGRMWLQQMNNAIDKQGITQQYCMSMVRHILQSVELPAVTQARASGDYHSDLTEQWKLGDSSILADTIGIYPTKDNAWSVAVQPDNPYNDGRTEPHSRLQFAVMTYSRGPVAASDGIGHSDAALIMRSCTKEGRLLQPDRPMRKMDGAIMSAALGSAASPINGETWSTFSTVGRQFYPHVISTEVSTAFTLAPKDLGLDGSASYLAWEANDTTVAPFSAAAPLNIAVSDMSTFQLHHVSPVGQYSGWALIGEMDKWVPTSANRFPDAADTSHSFAVTAVGDVGETINVSFAQAAGGAVTTVSCTFGESGRLAVIMPMKICQPL